MDLERTAGLESSQILVAHQRPQYRLAEGWPLLSKLGSQNGARSLERLLLEHRQQPPLREILSPEQ